MYWLLIFLPSVFAYLICIAVGNAIPALIIGGVLLVFTIIGFFNFPESNGTSGGLGVLFLIIIPSLLNAVILLVGSGIYYLTV